MSSIREMNVTEGTYEKDFGENTIGVYSAISLRLMLQSFHTCTTIYSLLLPSPQMSSQLAAQSRPVVYLPRPENNINPYHMVSRLFVDFYPHLVWRICRTWIQTQLPLKKVDKVQRIFLFPKTKRKTFNLLLYFPTGPTGLKMGTI